MPVATESNELLLQSAVMAIGSFKDCLINPSSVLFYAKAIDCSKAADLHQQHRLVSDALGQLSSKMQRKIFPPRALIKSLKPGAGVHTLLSSQHQQSCIGGIFVAWLCDKQMKSICGRYPMGGTR